MFNAKFKVTIGYNNDNIVNLTKDSVIEATYLKDLKEQDGSLVGIDVSIDGVNIRLFINSPDSSVELVTVMRINAFSGSLYT